MAASLKGARKILLFSVKGLPNMDPTANIPPIFGKTTKTSLFATGKWFSPLGGEKRDFSHFMYLRQFKFRKRGRT